MNHVLRSAALPPKTGVVAEVSPEMVRVQGQEVDAWFAGAVELGFTDLEVVNNGSSDASHATEKVTGPKMDRTFKCNRRIGASKEFAVFAHQVLVVEHFRVGSSVGEVLGEVFNCKGVGRFEARANIR